jgi:hypothetical protein
MELERIKIPFPCYHHPQYWMMMDPKTAKLPFQYNLYKKQIKCEFFITKV